MSRSKWPSVVHADAPRKILGREVLPASDATIHHVCERTGHAPGFRFNTGIYRTLVSVERSRAFCISRWAHAEEEHAEYLRKVLEQEIQAAQSEGEMVWNSPIGVLQVRLARGVHQYVRGRLERLRSSDREFERGIKASSTMF